MNFTTSSGEAAVLIHMYIVLCNLLCTVIMYYTTHFTYQFLSDTQDMVKNVAALYNMTHTKITTWPQIIVVITKYQVNMNMKKMS